MEGYVVGGGVGVSGVEEGVGGGEGKGMQRRR